MNINVNNTQVRIQDAQVASQVQAKAVISAQDTVVESAATEMPIAQNTNAPQIAAPKATKTYYAHGSVDSLINDFLRRLSVMMIELMDRQRQIESKMRQVSTQFSLLSIEQKRDAAFKELGSKVTSAVGQLTGAAVQLGAVASQFGLNMKSLSMQKQAGELKSQAAALGESNDELKAQLLEKADKTELKATGLKNSADFVGNSAQGLNQTITSAFNIAASMQEYEAKLAEADAKLSEAYKELCEQGAQSASQMSDSSKKIFDQTIDYRTRS